MACQWGAMEDAERGEPNLVGDCVPVLAYFPCKDNDDHDLAVRSRREDQQNHEFTDDERWSNAMLIAAAPDLLAFAKSYLSWSEQLRSVGRSNPGQSARDDEARKVIKAATGN